MLRVCRRVALESVSMHLENGRALLPDVVNNCLASSDCIKGIAAIHLKARYAIVSTLFKHIRVLGNILSESVDGSAIINLQKENRQLLLRSSVQAFCHSPVLRTTLADENNGNAIIILMAFGVQDSVELNCPSSTNSVRELLSHQGPATLKVGGFIIHVHRAASTTAGSTVLAEKLSHHSSTINTGSEGMCMVTVVAVLGVAILNAVSYQGGDGFLAVVKMHEPSDVTLHVLDVAGIFEIPAVNHHVVHSFQLFLGQIRVIFGFIGIISKSLHDFLFESWPVGFKARSHDSRGCSLLPLHGRHVQA
mmetsp:Transcript_39737/g.62150  ORF Transcript_39737/g.62150 Transcript_39737/m.62150 type:complete len:306 (+) Transcript_39737:1482-2399(+)